MAEKVKVKTEHEFVLKVTVLVDADEIGNYEGVVADRDSVTQAVKDALEAYKVQMADAITETGDWSCDAEVIGSVMNFEVRA
jgi:hypothetical protein